MESETGVRRICHRVAYGIDAGLAAGLAAVGLPTDEHFGASTTAQTRECPPDCPGLRLARRNLGGLTLPHLFDKPICGRDVQRDVQPTPESQTLQSS